MAAQRSYAIQSNRQFVAAREATPSPTVPGWCMSRSELADAVNAYLNRKTGKCHTALDAQAIGRYERGEIRWPTARYREALRAVLGVSVDAELGFDPTVNRGNLNARVPLRPRLASGGL